MKIGFVVNQVDTEKPVYTTVHMAFTAHKMGHEPYLMGVGDLVYYPEGHMGALASTPSKKFKNTETFLKDMQGKKANKVHITSHDLDVLFVRNDPSVDTESRPWAQNAGVIFGKIALNQGVIVLNHPDSLFDALNKMYFQHFPESVRPRTVITRNVQDIHDFYDDCNNRIVLKPLQGSGGKDVFLLKDKDTNMKQIVEAISRNGYVIAQEYLPAAKDGDIRLFVVNGHALERDGKYAALRRRNSGDDFRSNLSAGGKPEKAEVDDTILDIVEKIRPKLLQDGLFCVGLDIVGDKLMEINVFSPGGLMTASQLNEVDFSETMIKKIECKVYYKNLYGDTIDNKQLAVM